MAKLPNLREVYGVTSRQTQHRIMDVLRRKRRVKVDEDRRDGRPVVVVECPDSRAHWVFRKVTSIDPEAVLIQAGETHTSDSQSRSHGHAADFEMCQDCAAQLGGERELPPHSKLVLDGPKREFEGYGIRAEEQAFVCTACGQTWMRETGPSGYGWMLTEPLPHV